MARSYAAVAALRRRLFGIEPEVPRPDPDADWRYQQRLRESRDTLSSHGERWKVTLIAKDGEARTYYLRGPLPIVERRVRAIFPELYTRSVTVEPATDGPEQIDRRLSLST